MQQQQFSYQFFTPFTNVIPQQIISQNELPQQHLSFTPTNSVLAKHHVSKRDRNETQQPAYNYNTDIPNNNVNSTRTNNTAIAKATQACTACRVRKRRCDGNVPCSYCVAKGQECSFGERKKPGPKKRGIDSVYDVTAASGNIIVEPSAIDIEMGDKAEAFSYVDACWQHVHRLHTLSSQTKIKNPLTIAHKVQAYSTFAYTARLCGNKSKALMYFNQARQLAGQIYDNADGDSVSAMLLLSHFSMLTSDLPRATYYSSLGISLSKLVPREDLDYKLYISCQLSAIMIDTEAPADIKNAKLKELEQYMKSLPQADDNRIPIFILFTELNRTVVQLLDSGTYHCAPIFTIRVFDIVDHMEVSETSRLHLLDILDKITNITTSICALSSYISFLKKIVIPTHRAIINWKSGFIEEAVTSALTSFASLQLLEDECVFGLLSHFPILYLLGALVKMFLQQGQSLLAQQMTNQIKKVCNKLKPDLDCLCQQLDQIMDTHTPQTNSITIGTAQVFSSPNQLTQDLSLPSPSSSSSSVSPSLSPYFSPSSAPPSQIFEVLSNEIIPEEWNTETGALDIGAIEKLLDLN